jgi:hypothetical protein
MISADVLSQKIRPWSISHRYELDVIGGHFFVERRAIQDAG